MTVWAGRPGVFAPRKYRRLALLVLIAAAAACSAAAGSVGPFGGAASAAQRSLAVSLRSDAAGNTVPTGTGFALTAEAVGGTAPFVFSIDRFLPTRPVPDASYTFLVAGADQRGDSLFCPGELTFRARVVDATGASAQSDPLTVNVTSRLDFFLELEDRLPTLDDPLLRVVRPNLYGAHPAYTLTWDFGDGTEPVTRAARVRRDNGIPHRFPAAGAYHVRVTVADGCAPPQTGAATDLLRVGGLP